MRNSIILFLFTCLGAFAQAPKLINYQGVARDGAGTIITSGNIGIKFEILQGSSVGTVVYSESHTTSPSSAGIFTVGIGGGTPIVGSISLINWANGPYFIRIGIDPAGGTSYSAVGTSQLLSVPYALYAETAGSGSSLPTGTITGQTLYWDNTANLWKTDKNLFNDGNKVNVGDPFVSNNKMKIVSTSAADSAGLFVYKPNSSANQAAVRGFATGNANNSGSLTINPIVGGHFLGYNVSTTGSAVGAIGQGISPSGDAIGLIGVASSSAANVGRSVGVYGSATGPNYGTAFAAVFDRGKVYINDTIISGAVGNVGDVLTRGVNGKTYWSAPGASTATPTGPWGQGVGTVTLTTATDNVLIGTTNSSSKLNIGTPIGFTGNDVQVTSLGSGDGMQIVKLSGVGAGLRLVNASATSSAVATISSSSGSPTGLDINIGGNNSALNAASTGSAPTIAATNTVNGISIKGTKIAAGGTGSAGVFDILSTSNGSDALVGSTVGSGAAVHAISGTTTSSALALLVENGHIKAMGPTIGIVTTSVSGGFSAPASQTCAACNDVRGVVSFSTGVTGFSNPNFAEVTILFNKPYASIPTIHLTPLTDMQDLLYMVTNVSASGFSIRVYRSLNRSLPVSVPNSLFKFNYLVIE